MPRYVFDVHDGLDIPDEQGVDLPDLRTARIEAMRLSGALLRDHPAHYVDAGELRIDIRTPLRGVLATVAVSAVFHEDSASG